MEYGHYLFDSSYVVNMNIPERDTISTVFHELTHMSITQQSKYGLFVYLLNKANSIDDSYSSLYQFFINHMKKMQEGCCTFAEMLLIASNGIDFFNRKVKELRNNNDEYYKYVKPFLELINFVSLVNTSDKLWFSARDMYDIVLQLAVMSCDVDLAQIKPSFFHNNKTKSSHNIKFNNNDESILYFPDSRFRKLLKKLITELNHHKDEEFSEELINDILCSIQQEIPSLDSSIGCNELYENYKTYICDLYKDSTEYELIRSIIEPLKIKRIDPDRLLGYSIPETQNIIYSFDSLNTTEDFLKMNNYICFILGNIKKLIDELSRSTISESHILEKMPIENSKIGSVSQFKKILRDSKMNIDGVFVNGYDYDKKIINSCILRENKRTLLSFLDKLETPIVVNYKYYRKFKNLASNLKRERFIYCDRAYENAIRIIDDLTREACLSSNLIGFTKENSNLSFAVFVIKIKNDHYFLLPIVRTSAILVYSDIIQKKIKVIPNLEIDEILMEKIERIINCLYYY